MRLFYAACFALGVLAFVVLFGGIICALVIGASAAAAQLKFLVTSELGLCVGLMALLVVTGMIRKIGKTYR